MKITNKKECPKCKSKNVFDTGCRTGEIENYIPGKSISEANRTVYECKDCGELFIFMRSTKNS